MILIKEYNDVEAFHTKFGVPQNTAPAILDDNVYNFRLGFLREELQEYIDSHHSGDLATAIDSLVDLVYVSNGTALMMGFSQADFFTTFTINQEQFYLPEAGTADVMLKFFEVETGKEKNVHLLDDDKYNEAVRALNANIGAFVNGHFNQNLEECRQALATMSYNCLRIAVAMGVYEDAWMTFWNDVQRANMSKVRATSVEQSKRKSTLDVVKPEGWIGPITEEILKGYTNG